MKASFFQRLGAYIIDTIIVGIIASLVCFGLPTNENKASEEIESLTEKYVAGEVTADAFYSEYNNLLYDYHKDNTTETIVTLVLTVGYFVVFQYMNKGRTLGKTLLNIRVVDKETNEPAAMGQGILRSIIVLGIASTIIDLIVMTLANKETYMSTYFTISVVESIFIFVSVVLVAIRKDGCGLHDLMARTTVIKEGR